MANLSLSLRDLLGKEDFSERLAKGQSPEAIFPACSDSRISLDWSTQADPGNLFVVRNARNMAAEPGACRDRRRSVDEDR